MIVNNTNDFLTINDFLKKFKISDLEYRLDMGAPRFTLNQIIKEKPSSLDNIILDYGSADGLDQLRDKIICKIEKENHVTLSINNLFVCAGSTCGLYTALDKLLKPGDNVLIPLPCYPSYVQYVTKLNYKPVFHSINMDSNVLMSKEDLEKYIEKDNIRALIINTPHNPTGKIFSNENIKEIIKYCILMGVLVIIDEAYYQIDFNNEYDPDYILHPNVIYIRSFSKYYLSPGIRVGYLFGEEKTIKKLSNHNNLIHGRSSVISQHCAIQLLSSDKSIFDEQVKKYKRNMEYLKSCLSGNDSISLIEPQGSFFAFFRINKKLDINSYISVLAEKYKTLVIPGGVFSPETTNYIRIAFTEKEEKVYSAIDRMLGCIEEY